MALKISLYSLSIMFLNLQRYYFLYSFFNFHSTVVIITLTTDWDNPFRREVKVLAYFYFFRDYKLGKNIFFFSFADFHLLGFARELWSDQPINIISLTNIVLHNHFLFKWNLVSPGENAKILNGQEANNWPRKIQKIARKYLNAIVN